MNEGPAGLGLTVAVGRISTSAIVRRTLPFCVALTILFPIGLLLLVPRIDWLPALGVGLGVGLLLVLVSGPLNLLGRDTLVRYGQGFELKGVRVGRRILDYQSVETVVRYGAGGGEKGLDYEFHRLGRPPVRLGAMLVSAQRELVNAVVAASLESARRRAAQTLNRGDKYFSVLGPRMDLQNIYLGKDQVVSLRSVTAISPRGIEYELGGEPRVLRVGAGRGLDLVLASLIETITARLHPGRESQRR